jgi:hypothetical protein
MSMPGAYPLALYRGDSYSWQFKLWRDTGKTQPVDLTGATAEAEVRYSPGGPEILAMVCTVTVPNIIDMHLPAAAWTAFPFKTSGKPSWDLQVTYPSGDVVSYLAGAVTLTPDVTDSEPVQQLQQARTMSGR